MIKEATEVNRLPHHSSADCPYWEYDEGFEESFCMCAIKIGEAGL